MTCKIICHSVVYHYSPNSTKFLIFFFLKLKVNSIELSNGTFYWPTWLMGIICLCGWGHYWPLLAFVAGNINGLRGWNILIAFVAFKGRRIYYIACNKGSLLS